MFTLIILILVVVPAGFPLKEVSQDTMGIIWAICVANDLNIVTQCLIKMENNK